MTPANPRPEPNDLPRYARWLLVLILVVTFTQVPIYIYVLEIHSSALARVEAKTAAIEAKLDTIARLWTP